MFNSAFEALAEEFDSGGPGPIGVCLAVEDRRTMERRPEAVWPATELFFAGYLRPVASSGSATSGGRRSIGATRAR
jgi:hypothetical protein